jgi:hypothetical protein
MLLLSKESSNEVEKCTNMYKVLSSQCGPKAHHIYVQLSSTAPPYFESNDLVPQQTKSVVLNELYFWTLSIVWCLKKIEE